MSHLIEIKQPATTRSSKLITLERPSIPSPCKLSNRSFQHAAPQIWNSLPSTFRTPSYSSHLPSLSYYQFHKQLKTYLFDCSFHPLMSQGQIPSPPPPYLYYFILGPVLGYWLCTVYWIFIFVAFRYGFGFI